MQALVKIYKNITGGEDVHKEFIKLDLPHLSLMQISQCTRFMSQQKQRKSATLRALRVKNVLMCQCALPAYVLTYQRGLRIITYSNVLGVYVLTFQLPCVLMCQFALSAYVLACQLVLRAYVLTCQRALRAYVLTCQHGLRVTCSCANMTWVPCLTCLV